MIVVDKFVYMKKVGKTKLTSGFKGKLQMKLKIVMNYLKNLKIQNYTLTKTLYCIKI